MDGAIPSLELGGTGLETGDRGTGERETGERGVGEGGTGERDVGIRGMEVRLVGPEDGGFCMCVGGGGEASVGRVTGKNSDQFLRGISVKDAIGLQESFL